MKQLLYKLKLLTKFKVILLTLFVSTLLSAHPHTFIDVYPTFVLKENAPTLIKFRWFLDDMSSTMLIMDFDTNGNGKIDESENTYIEKEYFSILHEYEYYTYIKVSNKKIKMPKPENFKATIENNQICYSFEIKLDAKLQDISLEFGDTSSFVAMILKSKFVEVKGLNIKDFKVKISDVDAESYYGYRLEIR